MFAFFCEADKFGFHLSDLQCIKSSPCSPIKAEVKELVNGLGSNNNNSNSKPPKPGDDRGQPWEREKSVDDWKAPRCCA